MQAEHGQGEFDGMSMQQQPAHDPQGVLHGQSYGYAGLPGLLTSGMPVQPVQTNRWQRREDALRQLVAALCIPCEAASLYAAPCCILAPGEAAV
jgi:hypothetical protein